jgi:hypothetical protein
LPCSSTVASEQKRDGADLRGAVLTGKLVHLNTDELESIPRALALHDVAQRVASPRRGEVPARWVRFNRRQRGSIQPSAIQGGFVEDEGL